MAAIVSEDTGILPAASFLELAARVSSTRSTDVLRDRPFVQTRLTEAEAILNAARAYVVGSVGALWEEVCAGASDPSLAIAQARLAIVHAMHENASIAPRAIPSEFAATEVKRVTNT